MGTRLLAGGLLLASALLAWLAINLTLAARLLQAAILLSVVYVAYLAWHGWRAMHASLRQAASGAGVPTGDARELPFVSVVVPARDEAAVIEGVVGDLAMQAYSAGGAPRYEVLVVDDGSTDGTLELARAAARNREHVSVVRREPGSGPATKGAALTFADPYLRGDVLVVIDADARVGPDLLERLMRAWGRDRAAVAIQAQRRPSISDEAAGGWLVTAQLEEQLIDMASQTGRRATGGTAELRGNGMAVRRDALARLGGWNEAAITEDLDLSSRIAADGAHVGLAPEARVGEEAVASLDGLWRQRMRWAEGSLRRLLEHGPRLVLSPQPLRRKLDFVAFAAEFLVPPLFVTSVVASLVSIPMPEPADWTVPASLLGGYGLGAFLMALAGLAADGRRGLNLLGGSLRGSLFLSHWLLIVPAALVKIAVGRRTATFAKTARTARRLDR